METFFAFVSATGALAGQKQRSICFCLDFFAPLFVSRQKVEEEHDSAHSRATLHAIALQQASTH